jgi:hypothetical protein
MDLKKNDKLILVVGVVILVIAAVGVAVYTSPDTEEIKAGNTEPEYKTYYYSWSRNSGETTIGDSLYAGRNSPYSDSFSIISPTGSILSSVEVIINWEDDNTHGLLIRRGEDTLTSEIGLHGRESDTASSTGSGNLTFDFKVNDIPSSDSILAENIPDAENIIDGMFSGENSASFDIEVSVETGERILRLLRYLRDTGNDFELKAKYYYYLYILEESEENNEEDEANTTGLDGDFNTALGEFYKNLCYGRGMI